MGNKKSILFVVDKPNWAYHFIVKTWCEYLSNYECYITFSENYLLRYKQFGLKDVFKNKLSQWMNNGKDVFFRIHSSKKYSFPVYKTPPVYEIHSGKQVNQLNFDYIIEMAYYIQYTSQLPFNSKKRFVGLFTDSFPHDGPSFDIKKNIDVKTLNREQFYSNYLSHYDGVIVGNENLYLDYSMFPIHLVKANGIYRQNEFIENNNVGNKEGLTIGWTGTPDRPMKGFRQFIEPAVKIVQETGRKISLKTRFSGEYEGLLDFYKDVDLVVIASSADTGPSLFAEASLSNVPSISTSIGFPKMIIENGLNGIIVDRSVEDIASAIMDLYDNREKLRLFSSRIKKDYLKVLDNCISANSLQQFLDKV
ncbi:glycosyltransferase [Riemerella anatipestifer]|uniref:glycosyltransferase n=2 Tax=Riemerella anatipestifer TaxID=34085 RepID=UPI0030BE4811